MSGAADLMPRIDQARSRLQSANSLLSEAQEISEQETIAKPLGESERTGLFGNVRDVFDNVVDDVVEPVLTTAAGFLLGGAIGGINGAFTGVRDIYDWSSVAGWSAFLSDSTWGLLGTSLGNAANVYNSIVDPSSYRADLSERQNRQVFDGGFQPPLDPSAAITLGNVVSNLQGRDPGSGLNLLDHEMVHIQQNRLFGPLYPITYASWSVVGGVAGLVAAPFTKQDWQTDVRDMAYVNNPWEIWAHAHGGDCGGGELAVDDC